MPAPLAREPMQLSPRAASLLAALALAILAAASLPSTHADDSTPNSDAAELFARLDANGDGFVTSDEVTAEKRGLLRRLLRTSDANEDGKLDRDEFVASLKSSRPERRPEANDARPGPFGANPAAMFRRMDADGDGMVSTDEIPEERREGFCRLLSRADANGDGKLSREEFDKVRDFLGDRFGQGARPDQPGDSRDASPAAPAVFRALDKDGDGRLSAEEIKASADSLAALDKNGDGSITADELVRARGEMPLALAAGADPARIWRRLLSGDKNGDGRLSADELPERLQRAFPRLDASGDGFVDESELKTGLEKMRGALGKLQTQ